MATLKNNFVQGKMNLDVDERLLPKGEYRKASNIRIANSNGSDVGAIEKNLSNQKLTSLNLGSNVKTIGGISDEFEEKIYWLVKSDLGSFIIEYDLANKIVSFVLKDTRAENVLDLHEDFLVTGIVLIIDTDNNNRFLAYTDNNKQPRYINIERAKTYGENGFEEAEILLIKKPPLDAPEITLSTTNSFEENNIEEKFLLFFYRYKYLDGEYSALSPVSKVAFKAKSFNFDFSTATNESMVNRYNLVNIAFNTGGKLVTDVELIFKESQHNTLYLVEGYNKVKKGWSTNKTVQVDFYNNKIYKTLPERQLFRLFDGVPLKAKALTSIQNLLVFGNYTENWNLIDAKNKPIHLDITLGLLSEAVSSGASYESNKSNRDYEVGVVYGEGYGRHTTVLTSEHNTVHIPSVACDKKNSLQVVLKNNPPKFAEWFRIVIKQNRYEYDTIVPSLFYEEGNFVWLKLETADIDKIKAGDFVYLKADSLGILQEIQQVKILEIEKKERNFLETAETTDLKQNSGTYYKIKPSNYSIDLDDLDIYEYIYTTSNFNLAIEIRTSVIYPPIYYGETDGLNDLSVSGTHSGSEDARYYIQIDALGDGVNTFNTFKWNKNNGSSTVGQVIDVTTPIELEDGVFIEFGSNYGHTLFDKWIVSAKTSNAWSDGGKAYGIYLSVEDDFIKGNTSITLIYREYHDISQTVEITRTASRDYETLEEWFYEDAIDAVFAAEGITSTRIIFRRGVVGSDRRIDYTTDGSGRSVMLIRSLGIDNSWTDNNPYVRATTIIRRTNNNIIFETKSKDLNSDVFFEIGKTYPIVDGYHTSLNSADTNQDATHDLKITLPHYNCFAWGNGFESIKIKDLFNANSYAFKTKPNTTIEDYRENKRIASFTYSEQYSQSLNYNGLNEFNLSQNNSKDLDDKDGGIQCLKTRNNDLTIWQEDKVHRVMYGKSVLYNEDGSSNIAKSNLPFEGVVPYSGEFGTIHPESIATLGNYNYWVDAKRGVPLRLGQSGIEVINYGMVNWFRDFLRTNYRKPIFGGIDPHNNQYTITLEEDAEVRIPTLHCANEMLRFDETEAYEYNLQLNSLSGDVVLNYNITEGFVTISAVFNGFTHLASNVTGVGSLTFERDSLTENLVRVQITPISEKVSYTLLNTCPIGNELKIVHVVLSHPSDVDTTMTNRYRWGVSSDYETPIVFDSELIKFNDYSGVEGVGRFPEDGSTIEISAYKGGANNGSFEVTQGDRLGYLVSETVYDESDIDAVLNAATFPGIITNDHNGATRSDKIIFPFNRISGTSILYLIWDYSKANQAPVAVDDAASLTSGGTVVINVLANDSDPENDVLTPFIVTNPQFGTVVINANNTISYTHDGSVNISDSFTYYVSDGSLQSNIATVTIDVGVPCSEGLDVSGGSGIFEVDIVIGTDLGNVGVQYDAYGIPDRFILIYDNQVVADSKFVGDSITGTPPAYSGLLGSHTLDVLSYDGSVFVNTGNQETITVAQSDIADGITEPLDGNGFLSFNKTTASPTVMQLRVIAPVGNTGWEFRGVCPTQTPIANEDRVTNNEDG